MNVLTVLGLTALDRVLIGQSEVEARLYGRWENWCYFQGYMPDGRLLVATPAGNTRLVAAGEVESIEKREPVRVRAISKAAWMERSACAREKRAYTEPWELATVLMAVYNSASHTLSSFRIRMANGDEYGCAQFGTIHPDDFAALKGRATRKDMPVCHGWRASAEARGTAGHAERKAIRAVERFFFIHLGRSQGQDRSRPDVTSHFH